MASLPKNKDSELAKEMENYNEALKLKEEGNSLFKKGDLKGALKSYSRMLIQLGMRATFSIASLGFAEGVGINNEEDMKDDNPIKKVQKDADLLRIACFNNTAAVYAKMGNWEKSLEKAKLALELDNNKDTKAMFRIGVAYRNLKEYKKAKEQLLEVQKLKDSPSVRNELKRVEKALRIQEAKIDERFRKAFKKKAEAKMSKTMQRVDMKESVEQKQNVTDTEKSKKDKLDTDKGLERKSHA